MDSHQQYWLESLEQSLCEYCHLDSIPRDVREKIAADLQISSENKSMAFGEHCIPNPVDTEIAQLKQRHERELKQSKAHLDLFRKEMANRLNVDLHRVGILNGEIGISRS